MGKENIVCRGKRIGSGDLLAYTITSKEEEIASGTISWKNDILDFDVDIIQNHIFRMNFHDEGIAWMPETPTLFDVELKLWDKNDVVHDRIQSYFGFRKVHTENHMVYLNNKPYYQKLILDQGYWSNGLLTAPADSDLKKDIELAKKWDLTGAESIRKWRICDFCTGLTGLGILCVEKVLRLLCMRR